MQGSCFLWLVFLFKKKTGVFECDSGVVTSDIIELLLLLLLLGSAGKGSCLGRCQKYAFISPQKHSQ